jgi:hypothetical protein
MSGQLVRQKSISTKNYRTNNFWDILGAPGFVDSFSTVIKDAPSGQPSWLAGWILIDFD